MERLKGICAVPAGRGGRDLHSSMERLKGKILVFPQDCSLKFTFQYGEIKSTQSQKTRTTICRFTFQYGEIKRWRLLSSKERVPYLHSSMERLKVAHCRRRRRVAPNLHSSMERLKVAAIISWELMNLSFTFQYGEIKSWCHRPAAARRASFTFQYGEIKSLWGRIPFIYLN